MMTGSNPMLRYTNLVVLLIALLATATMKAQGVAIWGQVTSTAGKPVPYAQVRVCPSTGSGIPCSPTSSLYSNIALTSPISNPYTADQYGNFSVFVASSSAYILQVSAGGGVTYSYVVTPGGSGGSGSVTYVGLVLPTSLFTVAGSPVTASGTITATLATHLANLVFGNCTGSTATPTFCSLTTAMLPFTYSGNTTKLATVSGTLTTGYGLTIDASGNVITTGAPYAGSGVTSIAATTPIVASSPTGAVVLTHATSGVSAGTYQQPRLTIDTYGHTTVAQNGSLATVTYSATPAFNLSSATNFSLTLTGAVSSSPTSNIEQGVVYSFLFIQDGTGGRTFSWPTTVKTTAPLNLAANGRTVCQFLAAADGNLYPQGVCAWY